MMPICDYPEMARTALCDELQAAEFYTRMAQCAPTEAECMAVLDMARDELRHALHHTNTLNLGCITPVAPMPFMEPMPTPFFTPMPTQMPAPVTAPCPGFAPPASPFAGTPATPFMGTPVAQPAPCPGIAPAPMGTPMAAPFAAPFGTPADQFGGPIGTPMGVPFGGPMPTVPAYPEPPAPQRGSSPGSCPSCGQASSDG